MDAPSPPQPHDLDAEDDELVPPGLEGHHGPLTRFRVRFLLLSILLVALCSITYELIIGTVSSYLLGNSVYQFSLTIGLYMSAMGVGSYLSKFAEKNLLEKFLWVELGVGILGGISSALLFGIFTLSPFFQPAMWILTFLIGVLVGLEIPLLTRYIRQYANLRVALASVLSWDYIGALVGSVGFPLLLLPSLGLLSSAAVMGLMNLLVAAAGLYTFRAEIRGLTKIAGCLLLAALLLLMLFVFGDRYEQFLDRKLFQDHVIYSEQTPYQKLSLTSWKKRDYRLYINGNIQFASIDEYRYHEALTHLPMSLVPHARDVLILGGGDGLVVKQLRTHYPDLASIVMVDLDPKMTEFARIHPTMRRLNEGAMEDERLQIHNVDAFNYVRDMELDRKFDAIIIDLPDPNNESLAKLYSREFYLYVRARLKPLGVMVTQSSAFYFAPNSFWCIHKTIEQAFCPRQGTCDPDRPNVVPYHALVPTFGDWGFNLARAEPMEPATFRLPKDKTFEFLDDDTLQSMLNIPKDVQERDVKINRRFEPVLIRYYLDDWHKNNI